MALPCYPPCCARYFKQIVKSARANGTAGPTEDHTDDFLGCLNIPIRVFEEGWDKDMGCGWVPQDAWWVRGRCLRALGHLCIASYDSYSTFHSLVTGGGGLCSILRSQRVVSPVLSLPGFESSLLLSHTPAICDCVGRRGAECLGITPSHPHPSQEVPVAGADRWFKLEPRSSASRVQGDCHLVLKLITTQVGSYREQICTPAFKAQAELMTTDLGFCLAEGHCYESAWTLGLPVLPIAPQPCAAV